MFSDYLLLFRVFKGTSKIPYSSLIVTVMERKPNAKENPEWIKFKIRTVGEEGKTIEVSFQGDQITKFEEMHKNIKKKVEHYKYFDFGQR